MSGADDLMHSIARLSTALDRIAHSVPRLLAEQKRADRQAPQNAAPALAHGAALPTAAPQSDAATPNTDIAARLDSLIEQLRVALSTTAS